MSSDGVVSPADMATPGRVLLRAHRGVAIRLRLSRVARLTGSRLTGRLSASLTASRAWRTPSSTSSPLCLGGNVFGWTLDEAAVVRGARRLPRRPAATSSTPPTPTGAAAPAQGPSEELIGRWMAARGNRDELVIATKVGVSPGAPRALRGDDRARRARTRCERLGTTASTSTTPTRTIPTRRWRRRSSRSATLIAEGKIRYAAASNYSAERLEQALELGPPGGARRLRRAAGRTTT